MRRYTFSLEGDVCLDMYKQCLRHVVKYKASGMKSKMHVYLNTDGGDLHHAFAIYDLLNDYHGILTITGLGVVMSAGTIIMQAANHRVLYPHTKFMVHYGSVSFDGTDQEFKSMQKFNTECRNDMVQIYMDRCNKSKTTVDKWLIQDTYLNAAQALRKNLIDEVIE